MSIVVESNLNDVPQAQYCLPNLPEIPSLGEAVINAGETVEKVEPKQVDTVIEEKNDDLELQKMLQKVDEDIIPKPSEDDTNYDDLVLQKIVQMVNEDLTPKLDSINPPIPVEEEEEEEEDSNTSNESDDHFNETDKALNEEELILSNENDTLVEVVSKTEKKKLKTGKHVNITSKVGKDVKHVTTNRYCAHSTSDDSIIDKSVLNKMKSVAEVEEKSSSPIPEDKKVSAKEESITTTTKSASSSLVKRLISLSLSREKKVKTGKIAKEDMVIKEHKAIKWPKEKQKWIPVTSQITTHIKSFKDLKTPQQTVVKLAEDVYDICKKSLGIKGYPLKLSSKLAKRDQLLSEIHPTKSSITKRNDNAKASGDKHTLQNANGKDNKTAKVEREMDTLLSDHFESINSTKGERRVTIKTKGIQNPQWKKYNISDYSIEELDHILDSKVNTRSNYDGLCYDVVKYCPVLKNKLLSLFNQIHKSGKLPKEWHYCFVYDVYKGKGDLKDVKNYRCIVRVDTFSKLYWHLVNTRIVEHSKKHNLVNTLVQKAYSEEVRGVEENLFIHQQVKPKSECVVYLDIKNAYGSIRPVFLDKVLKFYGIPKDVRSYLKHFLENRYVYYNNELRKWNNGLPQGLSISNYLFILSINYILDKINTKYVRHYGVYVNNCNFLIQAFADDIIIYGQNMQCVQEVVKELHDDFRKAGLNIQLEKSFVDYVNKDNKMTPLKVKGIKIPDLDTNTDFKYLGQYAKLEKTWEIFARELKDSLDRIKLSFEKNLPNANYIDYWYAYQKIWRFKINWFIRVNDGTKENTAHIEKVEREWFSKIPELKNRITDKDFETRRNSMAIVRHAALNDSKDSRVVAIYKSIMGDKYLPMCKSHKDGYNEKMADTGFKRSIYREG